MSRKPRFDNYYDNTDYDDDERRLEEDIDWEKKTLESEYEYSGDDGVSDNESIAYDDDYDDEDRYADDEDELDEYDDYDDYDGHKGKKRKKKQNYVEDIDEVAKILRDIPVTKKTMEERRQTFIEIMEDYHLGDNDDENTDYKTRKNHEYKKQKAIEDAIIELDAFVKYTIKKKYSSYAKKYYKDLLQEGYVGIMEGMKKYDPNITMPTTFFYPYIIHEMQSLITKLVDKTTAHYSGNIKRINKVIDEFEAQGKQWTTVDISIQTGMTLETIAQSLAIRGYRDEIHIDNCPEGLTETRAFFTKDPTPEQVVMEQSEKDIIEEALSKLEPIEVTILEYRYGLHDHEIFSEGDTAKALDMPKDRVKKILNGSIRKLRNSSLRESFRDNHVESNRVARSSTPALIPMDLVENDIQAIIETDNLPFNV